jgi:type IV secretory pathway TrbD component
MHGSSFEKPLLIEMTTFGVDDWLFVANVELFLVICIGMRVYAWAGIALALHAALIVVTRVQPRMLGVYFKHTQQKTAYTSWSNLPPKRSKKPLLMNRLVGERNYE